MLQPSDNLPDPPLDLLQHLHTFPVLRVPGLDAVLQMCLIVAGKNHLPQTVGRAYFDAAQDMVGSLGCKHILLAHVELLINQRLQVLPLWAALNPLTMQPVFVLEITPPQVQDLGLVEFHEVHKGPPLQPIKVYQDGISSLQHVDCTTQLGAV